MRKRSFPADGAERTRQGANNRAAELYRSSGLREARRRVARKSQGLVKQQGLE